MDDGSSRSRQKDQLWALLRVRLAEQVAELNKAEQQFVLMFVARLTDRQGMGTPARISFWLEDLRQTNLRLDVDRLITMACENITHTARALLKPDEFEQLEGDIELLSRFSSASPVTTAELLDAKSDAAALVAEHYAGRPDLFERAMRVSQTALAIGTQLRLADFERQVLEISGLVYDIGKTCIDCDLLSVNGPLDPQQWDQVRAHTELGETILKHVPSLASLGVHHVARAHHERFDGQGYPDRLVTRAIPLAARIVGVADAYHAMLSARPFAPALSLNEVIDTLEAGAGTQWDPHATEALLELVDARPAENVVPLARRAAR